MSARARRTLSTRSIRTKSKTGPDKGWAWIVLLGATLNAIILQGLLKSSGVLYTQFKDTMHLDVSQAAAVSTICEAMMRFMGPIAGSLAQRFSYRLIVFIGGLLSSVGLLGCFFADSFGALLASFGFVFGVGCGLVLVPGDIITGLYFVKYRAMAMGIEFAGGPLGAVAVAPFLTWLFGVYQFHGTMLIYSGLLLHACAVALVYRTGFWFNESPEERRRSSIYPERRRRTIPKVESTATVLSIVEEDETSSNNEDTFSDSDDATSDSDDNTDAEDWVDNGNGKIFTISSPDVTIPASNYDPSISRVAAISNLSSEPDSSTFDGTELSVTTDSPQPFVGDSSPVNPDESRIRKWFGKIDWSRFSFFKSSSYWLVNLSNFAMVMGFPMILAMLPDFTRHEIATNITLQQANLLISAFNLADLVGRLSFGWLSDRKLFKRKTGFMVTLFLASGAVLVFPFTTSYTGIFACTVLYAVVIGASSICPAVILNDCVGTERFPVAYGTIITFSSIASFSSAPIMGLIHDNTDSYKGCFYVISAVLAFGGSVWLVHSVMQKLRKRKRGNARISSSLQ